MKKKEKFDEYLKNECNCLTMLEYVMKVIGDLESGVILNVNDKICFINENFGKTICKEFVTDLKRELKLRSSDKVVEYEYLLLDEEVEDMCFGREWEEERFDDYTGDLKDDAKYDYDDIERVRYIRKKKKKS